MKYAFQIINHENGKRSDVVVCKSRELYVSLNNVDIPDDSYILMLGYFDGDKFEFAQSPILTVGTFKRLISVEDIANENI